MFRVARSLTCQRRPDCSQSLLLLKLIDSRLGLRVKGDVEIEGLDIALHGEAVQ